MCVPTFNKKIYINEAAAIADLIKQLVLRAVIEKRLHDIGPAVRPSAIKRDRLPDKCPNNVAEIQLKILK